MNSLVLVANKSNEKYDVWTLADAAEYLHLQEKKMRRFRKVARQGRLLVAFVGGAYDKL